MREGYARGKFIIACRIRQTSYPWLDTRIYPGLLLSNQLVVQGCWRIERYSSLAQEYEFLI